MTGEFIRNATEFITAGGLGPLTIFIAVYLGWILAAVYVFVLIWKPNNSIGRWPEEVSFVLLCVLSAWVLSQVIKYFYISPRPFLLLDNYVPLLEFGARESFPSGHAIVLFAFGFAVHSYRRVFGNILIVGAVLVSLARIAAGLHWPSDVIGGFALAGFVVFILTLAANHANLKIVR